MPETSRGRTDGIIFMMHCQSNTGYAIEHLEQTFLRAAVRVGFPQEKVFFSYPSIQRGKPRWMPEGYDNFLEYDFGANTNAAGEALTTLIRTHGIRTAFVFDLQPENGVNPVLRRAGVRHVISYWGAPMSAANSGWRLLLKRLEVMLRRSGPDLYVFESQAMRELGVRGRGVSADRTVVIPTGVDTGRFTPRDAGGADLSALGVPAGRKVFVYTGHMEERKGVHVIVKAMDRIVAQGREDIHFLALGNRPGEEARFYDLLQCDRTHRYITFGGYRDAVEQVFQSSYAGVVASTGWDSWPMSVIEMAACGLPLLVSDLQGLKEFVVDGVNGRRFPPGDPDRLASMMVALADDPATAREMGAANRDKVLADYSRDVQLERLAGVLPVPAPEHLPAAG